MGPKATNKSADNNKKKKTKVFLLISLLLISTGLIFLSPGDSYARRSKRATSYSRYSHQYKKASRQRQHRDNKKIISSSNIISNHDINKKVCLNSGYKWTPDKYYHASGNPSCCGDDSGENYRGCYTDSVYPGGVSCDNKYTCCNDSRDCSFDGQCIMGAIMGIGCFGDCTVDTLDSSNDQEVCYDGLFYDQDWNQDVCETYSGEADNKWLNSNCDNAGPNGNCDDFDNNSNNGFCCGDDANEYYKKGKDGTSACCNSKYDYVKGGKCYSKRTRLAKYVNKNGL